MKKAAHIHHPSLNKVKDHHVTNNYSIKYVASPTKTYLVNPLEGEIDYSGANRNFRKFYNKVAAQPIVKYRMYEF